MGVKDQGLQEYLKDNERFADFVNGTLFAGKQIVDPCYLKEVQRKKRVSYKQSIMAKNIQKKNSSETVSYTHLTFPINAVLCPNFANIASTLQGAPPGFASKSGFP